MLPVKLPATWQELSTLQRGLISREQALKLGVTRNQITWHLQGKSWEVVHPSVYRVAGTPQDWLHSLWAAWLWGGERCAVSHRSAARLWGFDEFQEVEDIELTSRKVLSAPKEITFHRTRRILRSEVEEHHESGGLTVTTVARTIFDLGGLAAGKLERTLDEVLRRNLAKVNEFEHVLARNKIRGKAGASRLQQWVTDRRDNGPTDSGLETDVLRALREAGLPPLTRQHAVVQGGRIVARLDLSWPERRVAIQVHGPTIHRQAKTWEKDQLDENALTGLGWKVIKITRKGITQKRAETIRNLRRVLAL